MRHGEALAEIGGHGFFARLHGADDRRRIDRQLTGAICVTIFSIASLIEPACKSRMTRTGLSASASETDRSARSASNSSPILPTISSSTSSMLMMPVHSPRSLTTTARCS